MGNMDEKESQAGQNRTGQVGQVGISRTGDVREDRTDMAQSG